MKKFLWRALILFLALSISVPAFAACNNTSDPTDTVGLNETEAPKTSDAQTEETVESVIINAENAGSVKIVRSENLVSSSVELGLYIDFRKQLEACFSADIKMKDDFLMPNETVDPELIEIIVGSADRDESAELGEKLKAAGTYAYGIIVRGSKIAIAGSSPYLAYIALDYLLENLVTEAADGSKQIKLEDGFEYIQTSEYDYPSPREIIDSGREYAFYTLERIANIPFKGNYRTVQGAGSDGKYAYVALIDKSTTPETGIIHKYDMSTWEIVATSESMPSAHTNDITYDSKNHRLVISYCSATDGYRGIVTVNPDTLEFIEYIYAPTVNRGVCYLPDKDQYVFAVNYVYYLTNDKFETISSIPDGYPLLTTQGFYCDGDLIYDPRWDSKADHQIISVNTMSGKFVGAVPLYNIQGEPESIFRDGNTFVMNCGGSRGIFRLALLYKNWWE